MAWHPEVGAGSARATDYRDFVTKLVQFLCGNHIATVAVNNAGSGYAQGDLIMINASAFTNTQHLEFVAEVTGETGGAIDTLRIVASGSYGTKLASATVSAGGSGYQVDDVLTVQGGNATLPAKVRVATLSGSAVATVAVFEGGGVYSSTPSNPAATLGVGSNNPANTFAGDDACTLTCTFNTLPSGGSLNNVATSTDGSGTGATIDVTFAATGWSVDTRDYNNFVFNSLNNEKQVTLLGAAAGKTNKPYVHIITGTDDVGLDTRYWFWMGGSIAHNPALEVYQQPGLGPGHSGLTTFSDGSSFYVFPENQNNDVDFWFSADDRFFKTWYNDNPAANTDDGRYLSGGAGFYDILKTETEDPFPMIVWGPSRDRDVDTSVSSDNITSIAECRHPGSGPIWYYRPEDSVWQEIENNEASSVGQEPNMMWPFGEVVPENDGFDAGFVVNEGSLALYDGTLRRDRTASNRVLRPTPGSVAQYFLIPLVIVRKLANSFNNVTDSVRGSLPDVFWIYNDDGTGSAINNFSEDYIEIGSDRYRIFHNHVHTERYQYVAVRENV